MMNRHMHVGVFFVACALCIGWAGLSLVAKPDEPGLCCGTMGDCSGLYRCCDPAAVGLPPCDDDKPGICMIQCIRPSAN